MALTLLEAAQESANAGEVKRSGIIEMFARESDLLMAYRFMNIPGNTYKYRREAELPGVAWRGVNESWTPATGVVNPLVESLYIAGGEVEIDRFIIHTEGPGVRTLQETMKVKALAQEITQVLIKGDNSADPREPDGLQRRLVGDQLIANSAASGGAGLSAAKLDEAIDAVDNPTHIIMNKALRRAITAGIRAQTWDKNLSYGKDELGRQQLSYAGLPILTGYGATGNTGILPFEEAYAGGGTANGTSVYVVSLAEGGVMGIQHDGGSVGGAPVSRPGNGLPGGIQVIDIGEQDDAPKVKTRFEWYVSQVVLHGKAAARLYSISNTAVVA